MIDRLAKLENCGKFVLKSFCSQMLCTSINFIICGSVRASLLLLYSCMAVGLPSHPQHELAVRQCKGFSGMVAFYIKGGLEQSETFLKSVKVGACSVPGLMITCHIVCACHYDYVSYCLCLSL